MGLLTQVAVVASAGPSYIRSVQKSRMRLHRWKTVVCQGQGVETPQFRGGAGESVPEASRLEPLHGGKVASNLTPPLHPFHVRFTADK